MLLQLRSRSGQSLKHVLFHLRKSNELFIDYFEGSLLGRVRSIRLRVFNGRCNNEATSIEGVFNSGGLFLNFEIAFVRLWFLGVRLQLRIVYGGSGNLLS